VNNTKQSLTAKGTELWDEVAAKGAPPANWDDLTPEEQVAATRAGTELWRAVAEPEVEL
jgi:hypothetical protein